MLLGAYKSGHTLTVQVGYDYEDAYTQTFTVTSDNFDPEYQFQINNKRQKCEAVRFRIYDTPDGTGDGRGYALSGMSVEVGLKNGQNKLPASRRVG